MDYKSRRWRKKRESILKLDRYIDRVAVRYGKVQQANTVHHIYPVDEYPEYAFDNWNLISVSTETHNAMHDRNTNELIGEGLRLKNKTKPGEDWRRKKGTNPK